MPGLRGSSSCRPPGFAVNTSGGININGAGFFTFNLLFARDSSDDNYAGDLVDGQPSYYDAATNHAVYPPRLQDAEETQRWLSAQKQGDIGFDVQTRRLVPLRGARLTTIDETEWYATDQIPLAELRRRLAASPLEFYSLSKLPEHVAPEEFHPSATVSGLPTLVLQSAEGAVVLLRLTHIDRRGVHFLTRHRPLPPIRRFTRRTRRIDPRMIATRRQPTRQLRSRRRSSSTSARTKPARD